jgi:hypothetical protein
MGDYAAEFTRLSKYYPTLVQEESVKVRRIVKGLKSELRTTLIGLAPSTYDNEVEIASRLEEDEMEQVRQRNKGRDRPPAPKRPRQNQWQHSNKYPR